VKQPVVAANETLGAATVMTVTLSGDHRALDGAFGARWLAAFKSRIEQPLSILT
jgi:pyruvate dehydrogenase E2 component (dihydrolipoamide acetyltransferase)